MGGEGGNKRGYILGSKREGLYERREGGGIYRKGALREGPKKEGPMINKLIYNIKK